MTQSPIAHIELTNPDRRNALTVDVLHSIAEQANAASASSVLLLTGQGRVFCSGFDMDLVRTRDSYLQQLITALSCAIKAIRRCNATTVVHVQGAAIAGGCALAMACDIVTAQPDAKFGYPVHALGISPAVTLPVLLPAAGGRARSLLMGGDLVTGEIMHAHGIVHQLCNNPDALVQTLLQRGTHASHATKQWLNELEGALCDRRFDGPAGVR